MRPTSNTQSATATTSAIPAVRRVRRDVNALSMRACLPRLSCQDAIYYHHSENEREVVVGAPEEGAGVGQRLPPDEPDGEREQAQPQRHCSYEVEIAHRM